MQQFSWLGDLPGLGDDYGYNSVMLVDDVWNAHIQGYGKLCTAGAYVNEITWILKLNKQRGKTALNKFIATKN